MFVVLYSTTSFCIELNSETMPKFLLCLFLQIFLRLSACSESPQPAAGEFTIIWGSGGGFTGFAEGYILHSDGTIEKWSGPYFRRDKIQALGRVSPARIDSLRQLLAEHDWRQMRYRETGNMTTSLWVISGKDTTIMSWNGITPGKEVPAALQELYHRLSQSAESARRE